MAREPKEVGVIMPSRLLIFSVCMIAGSLLLAACSHTPPPSKTVVMTTTTKSVGPPPHAPAHGYRHKHGDGIVLVYDADMKVYVVGGTSDRYYWEGNYYRRRGGQWQLSASLSGPWTMASKSTLPAGLRGPKHKKVRSTTSN
jgi:hypothetical protein